MPALYLERGGRSLQTLPAFDEPSTAELAVKSLRQLVLDGRERELVIARIDGLPAGESPHRAALLGAGFVAGYRGLALRGAPGARSVTADGRLDPRMARS